jgi:hypothetical protein
MARSRSAPGSDPDRRYVCKPSIGAGRSVLLAEGGVNSVFRKRRRPITTAATATLSIVQSRSAFPSSSGSRAKFTAIRRASSRIHLSLDAQSRFEAFNSSTGID